MMTDHALLNMYIQNVEEDFFTGNKQKADLAHTFPKLNQHLSISVFFF